MRSHLEFRSPTLSDKTPGEVAVAGKALATLLAEELPRRGHQIKRAHPEDWGWRVEIVNPAFPLWIGCGRYEEFADGLLCFIAPSRPYVWRWLKRVPTMEAVERLATAVEEIIRSGDVSHVRWWTEAEVTRG